MRFALQAGVFEAQPPGVRGGHIGAGPCRPRVLPKGSRLAGDTEGKHDGTKVPAVGEPRVGAMAIRSAPLAEPPDHPSLAIRQVTTAQFLDHAFACLGRVAGW